MAISSGVFSTAFLSPETASFLIPSIRPSLIASGNLRMVRTVTLATASKPATGKREPRGIRKPRPVSPEMQALVGVPEIPRTQALKQIWAYIKEHNLQDPENKKVIVCDEKLKKIFGGKDRVGFLEIAGLISPHFL
ncbi:upstream activation factor subunit UAF30-like [Pistacia vera]|uniref:upstream activation factor subunit UAF30-like n=1 Tax=Pistacia vera TaxID=55513 RepID=UPI001263449D|nr:upstream activation factor subunit UAF30-like [Pistacia vera]XP_031272011.1 upstream activation factor subunit UAF30-like [Pistacia vera]